MQLILVDNRVKDVQTVTQSLLPSVDYVSVDFENDTYETLIAKIPVKTYDSVGIFQENYELNDYQFIHSFPNSVLTNVETQDPNLDTWSQYKLLLSYFKNTLQIQTLDLMGCNIYSSPDWNYVIDYLGKQFQININSSNDNTGSPDFGGNWILESGNQNLVGKYFSNNIDKYQFILGYSSNHTVILKNDGNVYAVGFNNRGQLGNGATANASYPVKVLASAGQPLRGVVQVAYGQLHTVFLRSNGQVYAVGYNGNAQLGNGTTSDTLYPVQVLASSGVPLTGVVQVASGQYHTVFLLNTGEVYAVGYNGYGQLGNGTTTPANVVYPVKVLASSGVPLTGVVQVSGGANHTVFLLSTGAVYAVGYNLNGQLGNGTTTNASYPVQVLASSGVPLTGVVQIASGASHTVFLRSDGTVYAVGLNSNGQLGNGIVTSSNVVYPVQVLASSGVPLTGVVQVSSGQYYTVFLLRTGTVYAVGINSSGQLGNGTYTNTVNNTYPVQVLASSGVPLTGVVQVSNGNNYTVFLLNTGTVYAVGQNNYGQLGNGTTTPANVVYPVQVLASASNKFIGGYLITEYNSYYYKNKSTITNTNLTSLTYSLLDYLMIGLTPTQLKSSPYNYTDSSFYNQSFVYFLVTDGYYTAAQMYAGGVTVVQMYAGGVTPAQMYAGGVTVQQMLDGGITLAQMSTRGVTPAQMLNVGITVQQMLDGDIRLQQMFIGGITPAQMLTGGITIAQMYGSFIYDTNETLTYDTNATSTTLATNIDDSVYNILLTGKNFKYYNLTTESYTDYNTLCISTNGWLGFSSSIAESNYGENVQLPLNTLKFFSLDAKSTIKYYFDTNNNLFISAIGYHSSGITNLPFTIVIKVTPVGLIQVHYQSIGTSTNSSHKPIIGWTGNNSGVTTDDVIYSTFNRVNEFVQGNINGKFLNFDFSTQIKYKGLITLAQMYAGGITTAQMYAGGITLAQMYAGGITTAQMYTGGITLSQMIIGGITIAQMYAVGITPTQMFNVGITIAQMRAEGITPTQMYAGGITIAQMYAGGITLWQMYAGGITPTQMYAEGITISQMYAGGITPAQMYAGGITIAQMYAEGITVAQMYAGGIIPAQMYAGGVTVQQMLDGGVTTSQILSYNIYESTNTLTYDTNATSTTLASIVDDAVYNIDLSSKNFKYYNLTTNSYTVYNTLCISTNGWLGFSSSIDESNYGEDVQFPLNTLRFFSFDAKSTIKYYFDTNNNLFISAIGNHSSGITNLPFTIVIKVTRVGFIQVHYQSIGTTTNSSYRPIIGWTGNDSYVSTDDIFYSTFNGTNAFVQGNINSKFLNFDFTGLNVYITSNMPLEDIYTYTSAYGYTRQFIANIIDPSLSPPVAPTISSVNGSSLTRVNPTITISVADPSDSSITNYSWSIDGTNYTVLSPAQKTSPLTIPATDLTSGSNYTFRIKAINSAGTSDASVGVSATFTMPAPPPAAPTISSVNGSSLTRVNPTITISVADPSDSSITNYSWSTDGTNYTVLSPPQNTSTLTIPATSLTSGSNYTFRIKAINASGTSDASVGVSATFTIPPAAPIITNITSTQGVTSISFQNPADTSITNYAYSTSSLTDIYDFSPNPFTSYTPLSPEQTSSPLIINGLHGVFQIKIKAFNGSYSDESTPFKNWYEPPFV